MAIGPKPAVGDIVEVTSVEFPDGQTLSEKWIGMRGRVIRSADLSSGEVHLEPTMNRPDMTHASNRAYKRHPFLWPETMLRVL